MAQISAIEPQKRRKGRFNIFVDGEFAFSVDEKILAEENLKVGQEMSQTSANRIIKVSEVGKILEKVFNFLSYRPRSKKEILDYLKKRNLGEKEKEAILKKLDKLGFIDDEEFARSFVQSRIRSKPKGKRMLWQELRRKGIEKEIIEKVLEEIQISEVDLAKKAIAKKLERFLKLPQKEAKERIATYLLRRGFSWETVKTLIDREGLVD